MPQVSSLFIPHDLLAYDLHSLVPPSPAIYIKWSAVSVQIANVDGRDERPQYDLHRVVPPSPIRSYDKRSSMSVQIANDNSRDEPARNGKAIKTWIYIPGLSPVFSQSISLIPLTLSYLTSQLPTKT